MDSKYQVPPRLPIGGAPPPHASKKWEAAAKVAMRGPTGPVDHLIRWPRFDGPGGLPRRLLPGNRAADGPRLRPWIPWRTPGRFAAPLAAGEILLNLISGRTPRGSVAYRIL